MRSSEPRCSSRGCRAFGTTDCVPQRVEDFLTLVLLSPDLTRPVSLCCCPMVVDEHHHIVIMEAYPANMACSRCTLGNPDCGFSLSLSSCWWPSARTVAGLAIAGVAGCFAVSLLSRALASRRTTAATPVTTTTTGREFWPYFRSLEELEVLGRKNLPPFVDMYYSYTSGQGTTQLRATPETFARIKLMTRILRNVSAPDTSLELFGQRCVKTCFVGFAPWSS